MNVTSCVFQVGTTLWTRPWSSSRATCPSASISHEAELCACSVLAKQSHYTVFAVCQWSGYVTLRVCSMSVERSCDTVCLQHVSGVVMLHCVFAMTNVSAEVTLHCELLPHSKLKCLSGTAMGWNGSGFSWDSHGVKWLWLFHTGNTRRWWSEWTLSHEDHSETVHKSIQENHWYKYGLPADGT